MCKYLLLIFIFLSGCPMGDRFNLYPAQSKIVDSKICIFFDDNEIVRSESILKIAIWKLGYDDYVHEKSYANSSLTLEAGSASPASASLILSPAKGTPLW